MRIFLLLAFVWVGALSALSISPEDAQKLAEKIWKNECGGSLEGLTSWNKNENFPSLGIGHFIWYPEGKPDRFQETFPDLLKFLQAKNMTLPAWLKTASGCPWNTRDEFYQNIKSPQMTQLRQFLFDTRNLQALFIAARLEKSLPQMVEALTPEEQEKITTIFNRLASDPKGLYALIDYVNFKGEGTSPTERYQVQGWGLLQVLQNMPVNSKDPTRDFVQSAKKILSQRVQNSPPEKHEDRWLKGWCNRLDTYLD